MSNIYNLPLVSIVTIVYNGQEYIQDCINSIKMQTYKKIEYIIIDGGSTDNTVNIIKDNSDIVSNYISEKDNGISDAFNKGIKMAKGDIIGLINADDYLEKDTIEIIVQKFEEMENAEGIYYGCLNFVESDGTIRSLKPELGKIWNYMSLFHPALFVHKNVYEKVGLFSLDYKYAMDAEFIHRCLNNKIDFYYIDKILANYRLEGVSTIQYKKAYKEFYKSVKEHGGNPFAGFYLYWGITKKTLLNSYIGTWFDKNRDKLSLFLSGKKYTK